MTEIKTETKFVLLSVENNVGTITLNNAPVNVLTKDLLQDLNTVVDHIIQNKEIKAVILTGAGSAFAAGADIKAMPSIKAEGAEEIANFGQDIFNKLANMDKFSVAAVNGIALGGGLELAMSCDYRIFSEKAKVGQPEINLGIIPGYGGTQRLTKLIGKPKAKELILTGDTITAQQAYDLGLADKVVSPEEIINAANELAAKVASKGQVAVKYAKKAIDEGSELGLAEALKLEIKYFGEVANTEDKNEGIKAFMEKRKPNFQDK